MINLWSTTTGSLWFTFISEWCWVEDSLFIRTIWLHCIGNVLEDGRWILITDAGQFMLELLASDAVSRKYERNGWLFVPKMYYCILWRFQNRQRLEVKRFQFRVSSWALILTGDLTIVFFNDQTIAWISFGNWNGFSFAWLKQAIRISIDLFGKYLDWSPLLHNNNVESSKLAWGRTSH